MPAKTPSAQIIFLFQNHPFIKLSGLYGRYIQPKANRDLTKCLLTGLQTVINYRLKPASGVRGKASKTVLLIVWKKDGKEEFQPHHVVESDRGVPKTILVLEKTAGKIETGKISELPTSSIAQLVTVS